jgi:hypothetical protein
MLRAIEALAGTGAGGKAIRDELQRLGKLHDQALALGQVGDGQVTWGENDVPEARTIQRTVRDYAPPDGAPWQFAADEAEPEDAAVLGVCAYLLGATGVGPRTNTVTVAQAKTIRGLRRAWPDLPDGLTWSLTRAYVGRSSHGLPTVHLDQFLAFAPWRSTDHADAYLAAVQTGRIEHWVPWTDMTRSSGPQLYEVSPATEKAFIDWWTHYPERWMEGLTE